MIERVSTTTLRDYLLSQPGAEVLPPETLEAYEREMTEQVIPDLLRRNRAPTTRELLQRMIASAAVFSDGSGVVTGYKINTGALHQLVGRFSVPIPMNLPTAALAAHDAAQPAGEVGEPAGWQCRYIDPLEGPGAWRTLHEKDRSVIETHPEYEVRQVFTAAARCKLCDGSGDIIDPTGEWRGYCTACVSEPPSITTPPPASQPSRARGKKRVTVCFGTTK